MMIEWHYECDFKLAGEEEHATWLRNKIADENAVLGQVNYIFCTDAYLLRLNLEYLKHDEYTDIITFDYCDSNVINGDIFISVDRVRENALKYGFSFDEELRRVQIHGILHLLGYGDKTEEEIKVMRKMENEMIRLFHVEQK